MSWNTNIYEQMLFLTEKYLRFRLICFLTLDSEYNKASCINNETRWTLFSEARLKHITKALEGRH